MAPRSKNFNTTTPRGVAKFPHLSTPDTKFVANGEYHVKLLQKTGSDEEQKLTAILNEQTEKAFALMKEQNPKFAKTMKQHIPFKPELDKEGNETGNTEFTFKMKAKVEPKGKDPFTQKPRIFDAKGKPVLGKINIGGGSIIKVNFDAVPFFSAKDKIAGVTLRLIAVAVYELKQYQAAKASDFGFEADDEGYSADDTGDSFPEEAEETTQAPAPGAKSGDASDF